MFGFSFLVPAFLIGAAAAAVPILLHLLKRETAPRMSFSAVRLLKRVPVEQTVRRRLRELLLLALRVAALVLLSLAFARPYLAGTAGAEGVGITVVAVDTSFSMSAPGRFGQARELAAQAVRAAPDDHLVAVVAFDDAAALAFEPARDRQAAVATVRRLTPGSGATRYHAALARATQAIGTRPGRIIVVTDLQRSGWRAAGQGGVPEQVEVDVADVGPEVDNLAVTAIRGEPSRTVASVLNGGPETRTAQVRLTIDGSDIDQTTVTVAPGVTAEAIFPVVLPHTGEVRVMVEDRDGYAADNARYAILTPPEPTTLLVVTASADMTTDALYLEWALLAAEETGRFEIVSIAGERLSTLTPEIQTESAAILLLTTRGLDRRNAATLRAYVSGGGGLLIVAGRDVEAAVVTDLLEDDVTLGEPGDAERGGRSLAPADARHPIFRPFGALLGNLGQVRFARTVPVDVSGAVRILAWFSDGTAALVEHQIGDGRILVFASDLDAEWNDFPRHPTFVPFVHEMMRYLARGREQPQDYVVGDAPVGAPREPGFATVGQPSRRVAINVDRAESDPARLSSEEFRSAIGRMRRSAASVSVDAGRDRENEQGYWRYGLGLMALALAAESLLGRRMA